MDWREAVRQSSDGTAQRQLHGKPRIVYYRYTDGSGTKFIDGLCRIACDHELNGHADWEPVLSEP